MRQVTATLLINKNRKVLLMLRDDKPGISNPGCWGLIGGRIEKGEDRKAAAIREVREETGLPVRIQALASLATLRTPTKKIFAFVTSGNWEDTDLLRGEGQALRFFELRKALTLRMSKQHHQLLSIYRQESRPDGKRFPTP